MITIDEIKEMAGRALQSDQNEEAAILYSLAGAMFDQTALHTLGKMVQVATQMNLEAMQTKIDQAKAQRQ